ncbi:MAG: pyruvate dehydrogenase complex dihydrolipoamide acetyltransferase [Chthoniobacterales bacterium]
MPVINMPKLSDTMTEGTLVKWLKNEGDTVEMGDILAEVETDKATMELEAFDDGTLAEIFVKEGEKAKIGEKIARVASDEDDDDDDDDKDQDDADDADGTKEDDAGEEASDGDQDEETGNQGNDRQSDSEHDHGKETSKRELAAEKPKSAEPKAAKNEKKKKSDERVKASPLARKIAADEGVDLSEITGSGPGGRIVAKDVEGGGKKGPASSESAGASPSAPPAAIKLEATGGEDQRIELSGMRRTIAERLLASKTQIPHFYLAIEVDAAPLMRLRKEVNNANEAAELPKTTVNDFVLLAVAHATAQNPKVNAAWGGDHVMQYESVNVAVAVAVDDGLITPVIRGADKLSLREISATVKELAGKARSKKLKPEDYSGGTITVSNLGSYGIEQFYAIVNPPQAAILAVGAIVKKAVVDANDEIVVGQRMTISLSGDHRVVDGAVGAEFMTSLRKLVENPALMLF